MLKNLKYKEEATSVASSPQSVSFLATCHHLFLVTILGFASGLPFALVGSTLQAWYANAGLSFLVIGMVGGLSQPYLFKFLWAPCFDIKLFKGLGRRKAWLILTQAILFILILFISNLSPSQTPVLLAISAFILSFTSASLDISIDAYRVELLQPRERGLGASFSIAGYRLATIFSGAIALVIADKYGFQSAYKLIAFLSLLPLMITLFVKEPVNLDSPKLNIAGAIKDLLNRRQAWAILGLIFLYKLGEAFTTTSSGVSLIFLLKGLSLSLTQVGVINKAFGIMATLIGSFISGLFLYRIRLYVALWTFACLQLLANALFIYLAYSHPSLKIITITIFLENFISGMGMTALLVLMMAWCNTQYTATQFALLSALSALPRILSGPIFGLLFDKMNWTSFYILVLVASMPVLILLRFTKITINTLK